jgi:alanine racemase
MHCITAEISVGALRENIRLLRGMMDPGVKFCAVVKSNAYGHGLELLAKPIAEETDALAVCTAEEALQLREQGVEKPILVLFSPYSIPGEADRAHAFDSLVERDVTLTIVDLVSIDAVAASARRVQKPVKVHIKIDTGMQRSGVPPSEVAVALERIAAEPLVQIEGACTHFSEADAADKVVIQEQLACFHDVLKTEGFPLGLTRHAGASAAIVELPETCLDMVRVGFAMYGCVLDPRIRECLPLRPVLRLVAPLMQVKNVKAGTASGYGLTYVFKTDTRIGLVPVGYGDGYSRSLSNRSAVSIRGKMAPVRGRVSMDQIVVDLAGIPEAELGDEVEIISSDPAAPHSAERLAALVDTIPYEILTAVGTARVRRILVE